MNTIRSYLPFILLHTVVLFSKGQSGSTLIGGRSIGLANASATLNDEWSLFNNIGGLSKTKNATAAAAYEAKPALAGANRMAAVFNVPIKIGTFGIGVFRFGDNFYNEQILSAGFSNEFGNTSLGLKIDYVQYRAAGFGTKTAFGLSFGGITKLSSSVSIGAYITNLNQPTLSAIDGERLPTRMVTGASYKPTPSVSLFAEVEKEVDLQATLKASIEYKVYKKVFLRTGFNFQPEAAFFGIGFINNSLKIDYAIQYSQNLNYAFHASVIYQLPKKTKENK